ncbi:MAG TPA: diacylglycerol kinase family protein [Pyrinomonadaceae bacterium]|jgi:diacylglycerol kinase (ATP)|nr:diacylglycerol kinase family protein [Pyrinomonadaceae bacterium]
MSEPSSLFVIINNAAARARRAWPGIRAYLETERIRFSAHESVKPGETEKRTRAALAEGFATVAVVGGDGTLSAAASGYFEPCVGLATNARPRAINAEAALAVLPAGTGDDFARGLAGGRRGTLEAWLARLVAHCREPAATRSVDVLLGSADAGAQRFVCLNAATLGIGAEVAGRVAAQGKRLRRLSGEMRFACAAVQSLAVWRNRRVRVCVEGRVWEECETNLLAVVNGPFAGGGMNFSPGASLTDGLLDVLAVCGLSRAGLLRELARVHRGGHLANPKVRLARGTSVRVEMADESGALAIEADGDVRGHTPAEFRVLASALRVVCF